MFCTHIMSGGTSLPSVYSYVCTTVIFPLYPYINTNRTETFHIYSIDITFTLCKLIRICTGRVTSMCEDRKKSSRKEKRESYTNTLHNACLYVDPTETDKSEPTCIIHHSRCFLFFNTW